MKLAIAMLIGLVGLLPTCGCGKYENTDPTGAKVQVIYDRSAPTSAPATRPAKDVK
jgi:hypothetical protein